MAPLSTKHLEALPDIPALRRLTQSLAMLDAILCPEWQYRYYSFNVRWSEGEQMASMRDGCGDDWFLLFDSTGGAALKGYAHESAIASNGEYAAHIQTVVPASFKSFLGEPAFSMSRATFCLWRRLTDSAWHVVPSADSSTTLDDGSMGLIGVLDGDPLTYHAWAEAYYEREVPLDGVQAIYRHEPLAAMRVTSLNSEAVWADTTADAVEIGYPLSANSSS